ncbi:MAG: hypothetical protein EAZ78_17720 [Oscillatoriales cyanobacterium]|nr:MAG: hypothetical protein EA000_17695 [Oscillatoriales cyanobacterium]TAD95292.1 MAG: hypothetical protein EAZ98_16155 [Oscillatoriales cyanobacterium]TAF01599.1 MAG: hypothetical protein EAZ78_17720 [Oscillatoriales cyanobacterium]TAF62036.1 MAG: hypothetical protein EAZ59_24555 [Oscillatoriales cyanobacterium]
MGWGRVCEIVCFGQLLLVEPAPTEGLGKVFCGVGAGLRDCLFWAIIVGGTRPYRMYEFLHFSFRLFE